MSYFSSSIGTSDVDLVILCGFTTHVGAYASGGGIGEIIRILVYSNPNKRNCKANYMGNYLVNVKSELNNVLVERGKY